MNGRIGRRTQNAFDNKENCTKSDSFPFQFCFFSFRFSFVGLDSQTNKNFNSYDDDELRNLLEEAVSYKGPKDKENKSDVFKVRVRTRYAT